MPRLSAADPVRLAGARVRGMGPDMLVAMLNVSAGLQIPEHELVERFLRADGPGGQHVNRTESAVELRFDIRRSAALTEDMRARLLALRDRRLNREGVLVLQARRFREQSRNRDDARARLAAIIAGVLEAPPIRKATRPPRGMVERRLQSKRMTARRKQARGRPGLDA